MEKGREDFVKASMGEDWYNFLKGFMDGTKMDQIFNNLRAKAQEKNAKGEYKKIFPAVDQMFNAFKYCPLDKLKVVLIGQDPYHTPEGAAHGLAFSSGIDNFVPPSLRIIFEEIERSEGRPKEASSSDLTRWAKQGVLLLNTALTVFEKEPDSHKDIGWKSFIGYVLHTIDLNRDVVFLGLGKKAQEVYDQYLLPFTNPQVRAPHPAAQLNSGGKYMFVGCGAFRQVNDKLVEINKDTIRW